MSQFTPWSKNLLIDLDVEQKLIAPEITNEVDPLIDFDKQLASMVEYAFKKKPHVNTQEINTFNKIQRDLNIKSITQKINAHDVVQKTKSDKYKTYQQSLHNEMSTADTNNNLDVQLDVLLCKKLDIQTTENKVSLITLQKVAEQESVQQKRYAEHLEKIACLRSAISTHDSNKLKKNSNYVSFETSCVTNEIGESDDVVFCITDKADIVTPYFN